MTAQNIFSSAKAKGFTLIELLVVIGILGILATALIATIDPFEQLRKANDSNVKNVMVEFLNANLRYYTTHSGMPWNTATDGGYVGCGAPVANQGSIVSATLNTGGGATCVNSLIADGELKTSFTNASAILGKVLINGTGNTATACYMPESKSGQRDPQTKFNATGGSGTACKSTNGASDCYYCSEQ
ncbi:MAG: type II secretion system protein [Candidatus Levybacteria bacterium]|nr:type II secretion system protein [Candidatus Levybacteria bacterium]